MASSLDFGEPQRIAAGFYHNIVLSNTWKEEESGKPKKKKDDEEVPVNMTATVWGFGSNRHSVLGPPQELSKDEALKRKEEGQSETPMFQDKPKRIVFFDPRDIWEVSCGCNHTVLLEKRPEMEGGKVWTFGLGTNGRLGIERPVDEQGVKNLFGFSLGEETAKNWQRSLPSEKWAEKWQQIVENQKWVVPDPVLIKFPEGQMISKIACGVDHTLCLTDRGLVFSWGVGDFGNLGSGKTSDNVTPQLVRVGSDCICTNVAAGTKHSLALEKSGRMFSWGHGGNGRLGQGGKSGKWAASLYPGEVEVKQDSGADRPNMKWVAAGEAHSGSIDDLGNVYCWGAGSYGRSGHGADTDLAVCEAVTSLGGKPCTLMALGVVHSLALDKKGEIWSWGTGTATGLQKDPKDLAITETPEKMEILPRNPESSKPPWIVLIAAGSFHSVALAHDGDLYTWGAASEGRLGLDECRDAKDVMLPTIVGAAGDKIQFWDTVRNEALKHHGMAIEDKAPTVEALGGSVKSLHCGGMHSGLLTVKGELYVWGSGEYGQTGQGKPHKDHPLADLHEPTLLPVAPAKVRIMSVAFGLDFCMVCTEERIVYSWGRNESGQLGLGTMEDVFLPEEVRGINEAVYIAAGDDHSAAILLSGELYTWGSSNCGKLGHEIKGGTQQLPRMVRFGDMVKDVVLGGQHSAILTSKQNLFTFGAGFYGRLGHGDNKNQYKPKRVEQFQEMDDDDPIMKPAGKVKQVHCAMYHTCIVDEHDSLWMCGRDFTVCATDNIETPTLLDPKQITDGSDGKVKMISVGSQHTMLITKLNNLFVWGDNKKGQLGQNPEGQYARITEPLKVVFKGWGDPLKGGSTLAAVTTGPSHSMAVMLESGQTWAWGHKAGGRLGVDADIFSAAIKAKDGGAIGDPAKIFHQALKLAGPWTVSDKDADDAMPADVESSQPAPKEGEEDKALEKSEGDKEDRSKDGPIAELQAVLQAESSSDSVTAAGLARKETELMHSYQNFIEVIWNLWKPPGQAGVPKDKDPSICEHNLRLAQTSLDQSLCRNLKLLDLSDEFPNLDRLKTHPDIAQNLVYFEELLWILQQQPQYLGKLAKVFEPFDPAGEKVATVTCGSNSEEIRCSASVYLSLVKSVFNELDDARTRHLFMAFVRLLTKNEIKEPPQGNGFRNLEWVFDRTGSVVYHLIKHMVRHRYFKDLHLALFDGDKEDSLMWRVENATLRKLDAAAAGDSGEDATDETLFALHEDDLKEHENVGFGDTSQDATKERERQEHLRNRLMDHNRKFGVFLGISAGDKGGKPAGSQSDETFKGFIDTLKTQGLFGKNASASSFKALFKKAYVVLSEELQKKGDRDSASDSQKKSDREEQLRKVELKIFEPILRLFMTAVLGEMLEFHSELMTSNLQHKMKLRWKKKCSSAYSMMVDDTTQKDAFEKKVETMKNRAHFNMKQLGIFLKKTAFNQFTSTQASVKGFGDDVRDQILMPFLMDELTGFEDETATMLTIDLYTSHFDLSDHFIMARTSDLLKLSNIMWYYRNDCVLLPDKDKAEDKLFQLLDKIMPPVHEDIQDMAKTQKHQNKDQESEFNEKMESTRIWKTFMVKIAESTDVLHNFKINHRFLEFYKDLCFCRESDAPIPRILAGVEQRKRKDLRLITTYKADQGPKVEGDFPYYELRHLLASADMNKIQAKDFVLIRYEFEEIQKNLINSVAAKGSSGDFGLIADIEKGKKMVELMKNHGHNERMFVDHTNEVIRKRKVHQGYLKAVEDGIKAITEAQEKYRERLGKLLKAMKDIIVSSDLSSLPDVFKNKALESNIPLRFTSLEKMKRKDTRDKDDQEGSSMPMNPSKTFKLGYLRAKKVVARMDETVKPEFLKQIFFRFSMLETGDWTVCVMHQENREAHVLFNFSVSMKELEQMQGAGKTAKIPFNDGFVVINCFNLLQLLARIASGSV